MGLIKKSFPLTTSSRWWETGAATRRGWEAKAACFRWRGSHSQVGWVLHRGAPGGGARREELRGRGAHGEKCSAAISTIHGGIEVGQRIKGWGRWERRRREDHRFERPVQGRSGRIWDGLRGEDTMLCRRREWGARRRAGGAGAESGRRRRIGDPMLCRMTYERGRSERGAGSRRRTAWKRKAPRWDKRR
jgi:hypothetical protein